VEVAPGKFKIDKRDERGRTIDVHALRHSFGTLLSKGGVAPRTAQAAMRHSSIDLTMNTYTDPKLLDIEGALDSLPSLPLNSSDREAATDAALATGTDGMPAGSLVPTLVQKSDNPCKSASIAVKTAVEQVERIDAGDDDASCVADKSSEPPTIAANGSRKKRAKGLEPSTSSLGIPPAKRNSLCISNFRLPYFTDFPGFYKDSVTNSVTSRRRIAFDRFPLGRRIDSRVGLH